MNPAATVRPDSAAAAVVIRAACPDDASCLAVLATQVFLDTYTTTGIRAGIANEVLRSFSVAALDEILRREHSFVLVAELDAHLVGFAQVSLGVRHEQVDDADACELDRLYMQEPFTGRRIGSRLLQASEQQAAKRGASVMWLTPWVHNARALAFYAACGYADIGATCFEMDGERHANRVLRKACAAPRMTSS